MGLVTLFKKGSKLTTATLACAIISLIITIGWLFIFILGASGYISTSDELGMMLLYIIFFDLLISALALVLGVISIIYSLLVKKEAVDKNKLTTSFLLVAFSISIIIFAFSLPLGSSPRPKGARIISNMSQLRSGAEILYSADGDYSGVTYTPGGPNPIDKLGDDIANQGSNLVIVKNTMALTTDCDGSVGSRPEYGCYCAYALLPDLAVDTWFCVDGPYMEAVETTINPSEPGYCDGTTFACPPRSNR